MMNHPRWPQFLNRVLCVLAIVATVSVNAASFAIASFRPTDETGDEHAAQEKAVARFLSLLEKSPRRGTAFDRVYGHHVENGTLTDFLSDLKKKCQARPDDGSAWMLLGLIESQRGQDAAAADAFAQAESLRADDPLASFYLGQSLIRIGMNPEAILALERATERRPQRADSLEIFQQLGRLYQRAQKNDQAIRTWKRLEDIYPNDVRVLEQIAVSLAEEGDPAQAMERFQRVAELTTDEYQKTNSLMQVASLQIQMGQKEKGIAGFEQILSQLEPDGWLYAEVSARIENAYLNSGDQDDLVRYYEKRIQQHPDDLQAISRLAQFLNASARTAEAVVWQEKALKVAPTRAEFHRQLIDLYLTQGRVDAALKQYEQLFAITPQDTEMLRDWGQLALRDPSKGTEDRQKEATRIWNLIVAAKPEDALTVAQTAELFQQARLFDPALALYEKAVSLAPSDPQYREYLGEFLHSQKRPADAIRVWRENTAGPFRTPENLARTAQICLKFGYTEDALELIVEAASLAPDDISFRLTVAEYLRKAGQFEKSLAELLEAEKLAESDEERGLVVGNRLAVLLESGLLSAETRRMATRVASDPSATERDWILLARYCEMDGQDAEAVDAIRNALRIDEKSIPALTTAARVFEATGDYASSCQYSRTLAEVDRRSAALHWKNVARLEGLLGNVDASIRAAEKVIESAPGSTSSYELLSELCFRFGQSERGIKALRQAVRISGDDPQLTMALASALSDQFRPQEAIEVYWRAFEKSDVLDDQTLLIQKLVPLYQQLDQVDSLLGRLERSRSDEKQRRAMTICLAQASQALGDYGLARTELEKLLSEETRDNRLIRQLSILCQEMGDLDSAVRYQQQLVAIAEGEETEIPLAMLLRERGETEQAEQIFLKLASRQTLPLEQLKTIDYLISSGSLETALQIVQPLVERDPDNWELLYRDGLLRIALGQKEAALRSFDAVLAQGLPLNTPGIAVSSSNSGSAKPGTADTSTHDSSEVFGKSVVEIYLEAENARSLLGTLGVRERWDLVPATTKAPPDFAAARLASLMWKLKLDLNTVAVPSSKPGDTLTADFDRFCLQILRNEAELVDIATSLAQNKGTSVELLLLLSLLQRDTEIVPSDDRTGRQSKPLPAASLDRVMEAYTGLLDRGDDVLYSSLPKSMIFHDRHCDHLLFHYRRYVILNPGVRFFSDRLIAELRLADRAADAEALLQNVLVSAKSADELSGNISLLLDLKQYDRIPTEFDRWVAAARKEYSVPSSNRSVPPRMTSDQRYRASLVLSRWIGLLAWQKDTRQILNVLNEYLDVAQLAGFHAGATHSAVPPGTSLVHFGEQAQQRQATAFPGGSLIPLSSHLLLMQAYDSLSRNDSLDQLTRMLSQRIRVSSGMARRMEYANLARVLMFMGDVESVFDLMTAAAEAGAKDSETEFWQAELQLMHRNFQESLETLNSIVPVNQQMLQKREFAALILAQRLGDYPRAMHAVEKLFGMRLDVQKEAHLIEAARLLGMKDVVLALLRRNERAIGNQPKAIVDRMNVFLQQGDREQAKQLARRVLQLTQCPRTVSTLSHSHNVYRPVNGERRRALEVLKEMGELNLIIADLRASLSESPDSMRLWDRLFEAVEANDTLESVIDLLREAVARQPDNHAMRFAYASLLGEIDEEKESYREYQYLLKHAPKMLRFSSIHLYSSFQKAGKLREMTDLLYEIPDANLGGPEFRFDIAERLIQWSENEPMAVRFLDKVILDNPEYTRFEADYVDSTSLYWKSDHFFRIAVTIQIPTQKQIQENPWAGLSEQDDSYEFFEAAEQAHSVARLQELRSIVTEHVKQNPEWLGGSLLLNWIDLRTSRRPEALKALQAANDDFLASIPASVCWRLGTQLDLTSDSRDLAGRFISEAVRKELLETGRVSYSASMQFARLISKRRTDEAQSLITSFVDQQRLPQGDPIRLACVLTENRMALAKLYQDQRLPSAAFKHAISILRDHQTTETATAHTGNLQQNPFDVRGRYRHAAFTMISSALEQLEEQEAAEAIMELLSLTTGPEDGAHIELFLWYTDTTEPLLSDRIQVLDSKLISKLLKVCEDQQYQKMLNQHLDALCESKPNDVSVAVVRTALQLRLNDARAEASVHDLIRRARVAVFPAPSTGEIPSRKLSEHLTMRTGLWIVARLLLENEMLPAESEILAQLAVEAAIRQRTSDSASSILMEWSRILLRRRQFETATRTLQQYLIVTSSPQRFLPADLVSHSSDASSSSRASLSGDSRAMSSGNHPLQISQFQEVMRVASIAAKHDLAELSQSAVRTAFASGFPVPDLRSRFGGDPFNNVSQLLQTVGTEAGFREHELAVASLHALMSEWRGPGYDANAVAALLESLVFPASHPREIELFTQNDLLKDARAENLGAILIAWELMAGRQEALRAKIEERKPTAPIAALVLSILLNLRLEDMEQAKADLRALNEIAQQDKATSALQLACHAAIPASEVTELESEAADILEIAVQQSWAQQEPGNRGHSGSRLTALQRTVNQLLARNGDVAEVEKAVEESLNTLRTRQFLLPRLTEEAEILSNIANEAARAKAPVTTIKFLGELADVSSRHREKGSSVAMALAVMTAHLRAMEAQQRYEAWRDWTMPNAERKNVRFVASPIPAFQIPKALLDSLPTYSPLPETPLLSNLTELVNSAEACGRLAELRSLAVKADTENAEWAKHLLTLIHIRMNDREEAFRQFDSILSASGRRSGFQRPILDVYGTMTIALDALRHPGFSEHLIRRRRAIEVLLEGADGSLPNVYGEIVKARFRQAGVSSSADELLNSHWVSVRPTTTYAEGSVPEWRIHDDVIVHFSGQEKDSLLLDVPLTGNFELTMEVLADEGDVFPGFGGVLPGSNLRDGQFPIHDYFGEDAVYVRGSPLFHGTGWRKTSIQVTDGVLRYSHHGRAYFEAPVMKAIPWIVLSSDTADRSVVRNLRIHGTPEILPEVRLLADNRLDGWKCSDLGDIKPLPRQAAEAQNRIMNGSRWQQETSLDWWAENEVLIGEAVPGAPARQQSRIFHYRPLQPGDRLSYEFFYQPGAVVAHPSVGQLAVLFAPDGVKSHWITYTDFEKNYLGLRENNQFVEREVSVSADPPPLKLSDWNLVELQRDANVISISLNGQEVYRQQVSPEHDLRPGIFRYKRQGTRVRNIVLKGDWPKQWNAQLAGNWHSTSQPRSPESRREIESLLPRSIVTENIPEFLSTVSKLPPDEALNQLSDWVLPNEEHPDFRLLWQKQPAVPEGHSWEFTDIAPQAPALELVSLARTSGTLSELEARVESIKSDAHNADRAKASMQALIAIAKQDWSSARQHCHRLALTLKSVERRFAETIEDLPEFLVAWSACDHPELHQEARELYDWLLELDGPGPGQDIGPFLELLQVRCERHPAQDSRLNLTNTLTQWQPVQRWASGRVLGQWLWSKGQVRSFSLGEENALYFQSPLEGQFVIRYRQQANDWMHVGLGVAGEIQARTLESLLREADKTSIQDSPANDDSQLNERLSRLTDVELQVDGRKVTVRVDGVEIHSSETRLPRSPWLMVAPYSDGIIHDLRILGSPVVPDQLDLLSLADLACWRADRFDEQVLEEEDRSDFSAWYRSGDELLVRRMKTPLPSESLITYQRPLLEDGEIEYEVFWETGHLECSPAIGNVAIVLTGNGARLHQMTMGSDETRPISADNSIPIVGASEQISFKERDWNRVRLTLKDSVATVLVNDAIVATLTVDDPPAERFFGLFRYANLTGCRIRNVVYRGNWAKRLPTVEDQELACAKELAARLAGTDSSEEAAAETVDFSRPVDQLRTAGVVFEGDTNRWITTDQGLRSQVNNSDAATSSSLRLAKVVDGDFMMTLDYQDLQIVGQRSKGLASLVMSVNFQDAPWRTFVIEATPGDSEGKAVVASTEIWRRPSDSQMVSEDRMSDANATDAGRLRIVRHGAELLALFAKAGESEFRLLQSFNVGTAPLEGVTMTFRKQERLSEEANGTATTVTLKKLELVSD